jgi:hypothetical protein
MKLLLALLTASLLPGCETIPIEAKACYVTKDGQQVCVGSNGRAITIDATFRGQK